MRETALCRIGCRAKQSPEIRPLVQKSRARVTGDLPAGEIGDSHQFAFVTDAKRSAGKRKLVAVPNFALRLIRQHDQAGPVVGL